MSTELQKMLAGEHYRDSDPELVAMRRSCRRLLDRFIGDDCSIGPRVQLLTALHPVEDHAARRARWETALPIAIGDNVWFGGGVIVCPGSRSVGTPSWVRAAS